MLRLHPVNSSSEHVIVETSNGPERDIWQVISERLGDKALSTDYEIGQAKLVVYYRTPASARARKLPIVITRPHRSNLREHSDFERLVARKYLPLWGLVASS